MNVFSNNLDLSLLILCEVLFVVHIMMGVWVGLLRHRIRKMKLKSAGQEKNIEWLESQLKLQKEGSQAVKESLSNGGQANSQRLQNLERFKSLYFKVNNSLHDKIHEHNELKKEIDELNQILNNQNNVISDLKNNINKISGKYSAEVNIRDELENHLCNLENTSDTLKQKLHRANQKLIDTPNLEKELARYKSSSEEYEHSERLLQSKLRSYKDELDEIHSRMENPHPYGAVKITEIEDLSHKLKKKEHELKQLRNECDTIARQYEMLATSSLKKQQAIQSKSASEKENAQKLESILKENARALEVKNQEIAALEMLIFDSGIRNIPSDSKAQYNKQISERATIEQALFNAAEEASVFFDKNSRAQMEQLQTSLTEKREALKQGFNEVETLHQNKSVLTQASTNDNSQVLASENTKLKRQLEHFKQKSAELPKKDAEIMKLNEAVNQLEKKYLDLLNEDQ